MTKTISPYLSVVSAATIFSPKRVKQIERRTTKALENQEKAIERQLRETKERLFPDVPEDMLTENNISTLSYLVSHGFLQ